MDTVRKILCHLFSFDHFSHSSPMVVAVAHRAIRFGFDSLSEEQKLLLQPFLSVKCCGYQGPNSSHSCSKVLEGEDLLQAYSVSGGSVWLQCRDCYAAMRFIAHCASTPHE